MKIHALDSRTLIQVHDNSLWQVIRRVQSMGMILARVHHWQDIDRHIINLQGGRERDGVEQSFNHKSTSTT
jgi:hypothetical protein